MHYHISYAQPESKFITLRFTITNIQDDSICLQLPSWRPGRYELQNFAKNIRGFFITDSAGNAVSYKKTSKDRWQVNTKGLHSIFIQYEYYANQLDAGGSYVSAEFLYINPVNCMMYVEGRMHEPYIVEFDLPMDYTLATQLHKQNKHCYTAPDFDYLADSPLIASSSLQSVAFTDSFKGKEYSIHLWFQGRHTVDLERLKNDTRQYVSYQITCMDDMPCDTYHFMYLMLDTAYRHGVEHLNSTVIALGKYTDQTEEEFYNDLLAISSHEFFHLWNVKRLRPADMWPYDYKRENYSELGYVYEGVTTYLGDLFLVQSGVWSAEQYINSLRSDLLRHYTNDGRFRYSLAESSWDTWLDGYVPGVPGRKISIYIEGLIAAWVADVVLFTSTAGKKRLSDALQQLYKSTYLCGKGYTAYDYIRILEELSDSSFTPYTAELINGRGYFDAWLTTLCEQLGLEISFTEENKSLKISTKENTTSTQQQNLDTWLGPIL